jgi:hypothetical protein
MCATCPAYTFILDLVTLIKFGEGKIYEASHYAAVSTFLTIRPFPTSYWQDY